MKKVSTKEFVWYLCCAAVAMLGIISVVFGIIGDHMDASYSKNVIKTFEEAKNINLRFVGLILIAVAVVVSIIVLLFNAKKAERDVEKKIRREQRIAAQSNQTFEVKQAVEVVEEQKQN